MVKIIEVKPLPEFILFIRYNDGVEGIQDLKNLFKNYKLSQKEFENVWVENKCGGMPTWNNDIQIDALKPYLDFTNQSFEQYIEKERQNVA